MERRINEKIDGWFTTFKQNTKRKAEELHLLEQSESGSDGTSSAAQLLQYIFDYDRLVVSQDDLRRRNKRSATPLAFAQRCCAQLPSDEQCTRRRKDGSTFCGIHAKTSTLSPTSFVPATMASSSSSSSSSSFSSSSSSSDESSSSSSSDEEEDAEQEEDASPHSPGSVAGSESSNVSKASDVSAPNEEQVEVFAREMQGIMYYVDAQDNVYHMEDILSNKNPPRIIAQCAKESNSDRYWIPAFFDSAVNPTLTNAQTNSGQQDNPAAADNVIVREI